MRNANGHLMAKRKAKVIWISYLKASSSPFRTSILCYESSLPPCEAKSSPINAPLSPRRSKAIQLSSISAMVRTRGGHIDPSASREARPSVSTPPDPSQASQALIVPSPESRVPFSLPQRRYLTWRPPISPSPEPSVHRVPPKSARTSGPGETSSQAPTNSQAP